MRYRIVERKHRPKKQKEAKSSADTGTGTVSSVQPKASRSQRASADSMPQVQGPRGD
jgi:hypothetical protein